MITSNDGDHVLGGHVHLSITHLTTFLAVVQYGSMTTAAIALTYSLSTVSTHVTQLERQLRTQLLERGPDGCELTPAGRALAERAVELLDLHDAILQVGATEHPKPHGRRRLATSPA